MNLCKLLKYKPKTVILMFLTTAITAGLIVAFHAFPNDIIPSGSNAVPFADMGRAEQTLVYKLLLQPLFPALVCWGLLACRFEEIDYRRISIGDHVLLYSIAAVLGNSLAVLAWMNLSAAVTLYVFSALSVMSFTAVINEGRKSEQNGRNHGESPA